MRKIISKTLLKKLKRLSTITMMQLRQRLLSIPVKAGPKNVLIFTKQNLI